MTQHDEQPDHEAAIRDLQQRVDQFQFCINRVAEALGNVCCGGVDSSPEDQMADPHSTTRVLVDAIKALKAQHLAGASSEDEIRKMCPYLNGDDRLGAWLQGYRCSESHLATLFERTRERCVVIVRQMYDNPPKEYSTFERVDGWQYALDLAEQKLGSLQPEGEESVAAQECEICDGSGVTSDTGKFEDCPACVNSSAAAPYVLSKAEDSVLHEALLRLVKPAAAFIHGLERAAEICVELNAFDEDDPGKSAADAIRAEIERLK